MGSLSNLGSDLPQIPGSKLEPQSDSVESTAPTLSEDVGVMSGAGADVKVVIENGAAHPRKKWWRKPKTVNENEPVKTVPLLSLYKYADKIDVLLMIVGIVAALGSGCVVPTGFILFGDVTNQFNNNSAVPLNNTGGLPTNGSSLKSMFLSNMYDLALKYMYIGIAALVFAVTQHVCWSVAGVRQIHRIRLKFFRALLEHDISWYDQTDPGQLATRLSDDILNMTDGLNSKVTMLFQALSMFIAGLTIGFFNSALVSAVLIAAAPALAIVGAVMGYLLGKLTSQGQTFYAKAGSVAEEVLSSVKTVLAFNGEEKEIKRYHAQLTQAMVSGVRGTLLSGFGIGSFFLVLQACYALAFWYGSKLIYEGRLDSGRLITAFLSVMVASSNIGQAGPSMEGVAKARGAAFHVFKIIDEAFETHNSSSEGKNPRTVNLYSTPPADSVGCVTGDIEMRDVFFSYPSRSEVEVLKGMSLRIKPGQTAAIVGGSGSGKSTLVKLLTRFYDVTKGKLLVDGEPIQSYNVEALRRNIGVVSQEPVLFNLSIAENIRLGKENATNEEISNAAVEANADGFIRKLPMGYDTVVGSGGSQLSGGQKQRIAIARALIRNPSILLLDEATSALDNESEAVVQAALEKAAKGRTTIIVAHRLSTIQNADVILVVDKGTIVETGTHDQLIKLKGIYYDLVEIQLRLKESVPGDVKKFDEIDDSPIVRRQATPSSGQRSDARSPSTASIRMSFRRKSITENKSMELILSNASQGTDEEQASFFRVLALSRPEWLYIFFACIGSMTVGGFPVGFSIILSEILGTNPNPTYDDYKKSTFYALMFLVMGFVMFVASVVQFYFSGKAGESLVYRVRMMTFNSMLNQDLSFYDNPENSVGVLATRLAEDATAIKGVTTSRITTLVQVLAMFLTSIIVSFCYSWLLTIGLIGFLPLLLLTGMGFKKMQTSSVGDEKKRLSSASSMALEVLQHIRTVAALCRERNFYNRYFTLLNQSYKKSIQTAVVFGMVMGFSTSIGLFTNSAAFAFGGYLFSENKVTFPTVLKVLLSLSFTSIFAGNIMASVPDYVKGKISAARLFKIMDRKTLIQSDDPRGVSNGSINGKVSFQSVEFSYPNRPTVAVLKGMSFDVNPGQTLALVGESGCGKSTTMGLLQRFYDVCGGSLLVDDRDIRKYNLRWLRRQVGIVSQEPVLFDCSISDNITYGLPMGTVVPEGTVVAAATAANIHNDILKLPQGYSTVVGSKGCLLSGGQKQRIAIARALIRNPKVLLLDEATSALDAESEKIVQQALDNARQGRTCIVIAHRLSTIYNSDVIAVVRNGKIVESGSHSELMDKQGCYYLLNAAQD